MSLKAVTVFGGSGFIGRHLIKRLAKTGAIITVATRRPEGAKFLKPMGDVGQIVPIAVDIFNDEDVAKAVAGADAVVNLIGILAEGGKQRFRTVQGEAPGRIARAAAAAGVKHFVQVSAIGADPAAASHYASSKGKGEAAVREAFPKAVILRPSIVFGPEDHFFNRFASMASVLPCLPLIGGGKTRFQPIYVGDVAEAIMASLQNGSIAGKTYELGGPRVFTFRQVLELILSIIKKQRRLVSLPFGIASLQAAFLEWIPGAPLTRDQVRLLKSDNVVGDKALTLADLSIVPTAVELIVPSYLDRFRIGGRFSTIRRRA